MATLVPKKHMVKVDTKFVLSANEPSVYVHAADGYPAHAWPISDSQGLSGGPPYVPWDIIGHAPVHPPKPRRRGTRSEEEVVEGSEPLVTRLRSHARDGSGNGIGA